MSPHERFTALLSGGTPDKAPRIPILMQFAAEYIGSNYGAFASDYRVLSEANIRCAQDFDFDQLSTISDPYRETAGFGAPIGFLPNSVPHCLKPPLEDNPDFHKLTPPDPETAPRMRDRVDAVREYRRRTGDHYSVLGWVEGPAAEAADLRGIENFMVDLLEEPEATGGLMDFCVDTAIRFGLAQIQAGADTIGIGDAVASQVSPGVYQDLIWPRELRLVQALRDAGAFVRLHICGNITALLPHIARLPINILDADHMVDLAHARQTLGPDIVLAGNLDPVSAVLRSTPGAIRAGVKHCREQAGPRFCINAGCEIPSGTPHENLRTLCAALE